MGRAIRSWDADQRVVVMGTGGLSHQLDGERAAEEPKVFTHVKMIYRLKGKNLKPGAVERAIKLSEEKYCSATAMFRHTAKIESTWTVEEG